MRTDKLSVLAVTLCAVISVVTGYGARLDSHVEKVVDATNEFAMSLMKEVSGHTGNIIMSPLSVATLLAMLQQGAKENSATQLENVLHLSSEDSKNGYQSLIDHLNSRQSKTVLKFANSIFLNTNFDLLSEYQLAVSRGFHATVQPADFRQPARAAQKVNQWVSDSTNGKITEIVKPEAITGRTEMILANAMYFKGNWFNPFNPNKTVVDAFYSTNSRAPIRVDMMSLDKSLRAAEDKELRVKWVELPYDSFDYSLILVLPDDNLDALIQRMNANHLKLLARADSAKDVKLKMPRFKLESSLSLVPVLTSLGVQDVFSQNSNLEGISVTKTPLVVSDVLHKARIEVNEQGSEAAAASAVLVNTLSLPPDYDDLEITFNRPFLAIVLDKISKLPLFMAKVVDPSRT